MKKRKKARKKHENSKNFTIFVQINLYEEEKMKASISMESLWQIIQSLSLKNKEWLSSKLIENIREENEDINKEELLKKIDAGLKEVKLYKEGKLELKTLEEALNEL